MTSTQFGLQVRAQARVTSIEKGPDELEFKFQSQKLIISLYVAPGGLAFKSP